MTVPAPQGESDSSAALVLQLLGAGLITLATAKAFFAPLIDQLTKTGIIND